MTATRRSTTVQGILPMRFRTLIPVIAIGIGLAVVSGCEPKNVNRSPSPDDDPDRYARALEDERRVLVESREAEARFFRQIRASPEAVEDSEALASSESDEITP